MKSFFSSNLRAHSVLAILAAIFTTQVKAILDQNTNTLSDLWEKQHNNGNLFPNTFLATNDDDKDGWTNSKESIAGTNPFEANPPDGIVAVTITPSLFNGAFTLTWPTLVGKNYQLQFSTDLQQWSNLGDPVTTTQNIHSIGINTTQPDNSIAPKVFWRVNVTDLDTDLDGLTNTEEHTLGTNPNNADTDGDTINDKAEILAATNPLDEDTDEDGLADNLDAPPLANDALADPDGANLAAHLNNSTTETNGVKLIARYDFQSLPNGVSGGFPSAISNIPAASAYNVGWDIFENPSGIPSFTCRWNSAPTANEYLSLPYQILNNRTKHAWSYWIKLPKNAFVPSAQNIGIRSLLSIGYNRYATSVIGESSPRPALHWYCDIATGKIRAETYQVQIGTAFQLGTGWNIPAAWNDGQWHHFVLTKSDTKYNIYFDGNELGERTSNNINLPLTTNSYTLIGRRDLTPETNSDTNYRFPAGARIDRLRAYTKLTQADVTALYNQDIDRDGLYDRTESRHRLWQDRNQNSIRNADESDYILRPFHHDSTTSDHDRDGITSHSEQNGPTISDPGNFDTDGDLLPDGWEKLHNLSYNNPTAPPNTHQDPDNDGSTNFKEYLNRTLPTLIDTDGDGVNDGPEDNQGSDGTDASDQGQAPDLAQTFSLRLGVGDESGSESERYELVASEYDWATRTEKEVFRMGAENYGDYVEETVQGFNSYRKYTIRIEWKGTKLDNYNGAGPDFDYTLKVENSDAQNPVTIYEPLDPTTGQFGQGKITGKYNNVLDFRTNPEKYRVVVEKLFIDVAMDYNMDGRLQTLRSTFGGIISEAGPDENIKDQQLFDANPERYCYIDINNNNTDHNTSGSATKNQVDNENNTLDTEADRAEMQSNTDGHAFGRLRIWSTPHTGFAMEWNYRDPQQYQMQVRLANIADRNTIRIFMEDTFNETDGLPKTLNFDQETGIAYIDPNDFFKLEKFTPDLPQNWSRTLCVEGIKPGRVTLFVEVIDMYPANGNGPVTVISKPVRVQVNVDQMAQAPNDVGSKQDAIPLRGKHPHYMGIRDWTLPASARAVRGVIYARVPSFRLSGGDADFNTHFTWMRDRVMRKLSSANQVDTGQSLWIGLRQQNGNSLQWVQCGLRWAQEPDDEIGRYPIAYLETGAFLPQFSQKPEISRFNAAPTGFNGGYSNVIGARARPLDLWHQDRIAMEFIMFKQFVKQQPVELEKTEEEEASGSANEIEDFGEVVNPDGSIDITSAAWKVVFRLKRGDGGTAVAADYFVLSASAPTPNNLPQFIDEYRDAYKAQHLNTLDACMETNQSVAFAPGKEDQKGGFESIDTADALLPGIANGSQPADVDKLDLWHWLDTSLNWRATNDPDNERTDLSLPGVKIKQVVRTGKNITGQPAQVPPLQDANDPAEIDQAPHPTWRYQQSGNGVLLWDTQNNAFGQSE